MAKVIHIHLTHGIEGTKRKDWYFSSITAIYTVLTAEQVGATKNYLLHAGLSGNGTVCTKKAIILDYIRNADGILCSLTTSQHPSGVIQVQTDSVR